ncbi:MAG TPA: EamA family transporter [Candidatus Dormibacteraeota bacterium]|nr:EamA family transporter [Candidatus Dormibacteraeota bacterium]
MLARTLAGAPKAPPQANHNPARASSLLLASFAAVYILWGSTFFAIRIGVESIPPLVLAGLRHLSVGLVFYPVFRRVSGEKPTLRQWRTAIVTGILLLLCGNGTVSWAEKTIPSGIAALLVATVSLWMVLVDWFRPGGVRPAPRVLAGLVLGFAGMAVLAGPKHLGGAERVNPLGAFALVLASLAWAIGSIYSKHHPIPNSALLGVAMQMVAGGTALLVVAGIGGEYRDLHLAQVTLHSWLALGYLAVFGSALGFSAYVYILKHGTAARVATYAFVNPVVALFLGWLLGSEALTLRTVLASTVILTAVILVITMPHKDSIEANEAIPAPGEA